MAHDIVETYAGDTFFHSKDQNLHDSKANREAEAAKRIAKEFPEFSDLHKIIHDYENKVDKESKFIYALDKIVPVLNIYIDHGRSWKRDKVSLEMLKKKDEKIAVSDELFEIWTEFKKLLKENEYQLFQ